MQNSKDSNSLSGYFPYHKYRPNDISGWKSDMLDLFYSLDLNVAIEHEKPPFGFLGSLNRDQLSEDEIKIQDKVTFRKLQARCNTLLKRSLSAKQQVLLRGLAGNTKKIWDILTKAPRPKNKRSQISLLISMLFTTKISSCGSYKSFTAAFDDITNKLIDLKGCPEDEDLRDHFLRGLDTESFTERLDVAFAKTTLSEVRSYIDDTEDLRERYAYNAQKPVCIGQQRLIRI